MTKDEALQMCLEYIETNAHERRHVRWAIKEALAQPAQEPVQDENAIRADEREACAKVCDAWDELAGTQGILAKAIRARGDHENSD